MGRSNTTGPDLPAHDSSGPPDGDRIRVGAVGRAVLLLGGSLLLLVWVGQSGFAVASTYGGLGGGWGELLLLTALGVGVVVGGCLVAAVRLLGRGVRARWLVLTGVALALLVTAIGVWTGSRAYTSAAVLAEHACDDPVGRALVAFAEGLEPGPLVVQDDELTRGRQDGRCLVQVNLAPDADVDAEVARVATANGWSPLDDGWRSPQGVAMTYEATREPQTMTVIELQGHRPDDP